MSLRCKLLRFRMVLGLWNLNTAKLYVDEEPASQSTLGGLLRETNGVRARATLRYKFSLCEPALCYQSL